MRGSGTRAEEDQRLTEEPSTRSSYWRRTQPLPVEKEVVSTYPSFKSLPTRNSTARSQRFCSFLFSQTACQSQRRGEVPTTTPPTFSGTAKQRYQIQPRQVSPLDAKRSFEDTHTPPIRSLPQHSSCHSFRDFTSSSVHFPLLSPSPLPPPNESKTNLHPPSPKKKKDQKKKRTHPKQAQTPNHNPVLRRHRLAIHRAHIARSRTPGPGGGGIERVGGGAVVVGAGGHFLVGICGYLWVSTLGGREGRRR